MSFLFLEIEMYRGNLRVRTLTATQARSSHAAEGGAMIWGRCFVFIQEKERKSFDKGKQGACSRHCWILSRLDHGRLYTIYLDVAVPVPTHDERKEGNTGEEKKGVQSHDGQRCNAIEGRRGQ